MKCMGGPFASVAACLTTIVESKATPELHQNYREPACARTKEGWMSSERTVFTGRLGF